VIANEESSPGKAAPPPAALPPAADAAKAPANAVREVPAPTRPSTERKDQPSRERDKGAAPAEKRSALADRLDTARRQETGQAAAPIASSGFAARAVRIRGATSILDSARAAPPAAAPQPSAPSAGARKLGDERLRLDEVVVTAVPSAAPVVTSMAKTEAVVESISFFDAITRLGGTLRLVEGLVPIRVEALGPRIRVVYPLGRRELYLEQWRTADGVRWSLSAPGGLPADSLEQLKARVRE
jgi:hypothetical protein